jgi:hypothetical protein
MFLLVIFALVCNAGGVEFAGRLTFQVIEISNNLLFK